MWGLPVWTPLSHLAKGLVSGGWRGGREPEGALGHPQPSLWEGEKGVGVGEGRQRCCFVIPNNCGLILQVCIRKYKTRQFVGSSNFQSPESSKNYFSYPR